MSLLEERRVWGIRQQAIRACCDSPINDVISRCYPSARLIKVGTGGYKLVMSHRVDNFSEWKVKYELKNIVICPRQRRKFACLRDQSGPCNIFNSFHWFKDRCTIICIRIWRNYLLLNKCLPTHKSIANNLNRGYILDVVSLEKSKGLWDELSSLTCSILNHSRDASRVMLKQCNLGENKK